MHLERPGRVYGTRPTRDPGVRAAAGAVSLGHDLVVGASLAAVGGVYATPYLGAYGHTYGTGSVAWYGCPSSYGYYHYGYSAIPGCYYSPFGFGFTGTGWAFALTFGLDDWYYCPWYWGAYTAAWLPVWYSVYRPYEPYYRSEVVYETVVIDNTAQAAQPAVAPAPAQVAPAAPQPSDSESAAADRYLQLGDQAFRDGRYTDAVQLYAKAIEFSPKDGALYFVLSDALFAAGDYHYGAYAIRRGLELDHTLVQAEVDKHEFYGDPSLFDHQLAVLEQYLIDHPADRDARLVLALNDLFGQRPAAAVDLLEAPEASALAEDSAALLILDAARAAQYGH